MKDKNSRRLKVYGQSNGYNYQDVPTIVLKGKWLEAAGFDIGNYVTISCENEQLIITHDNRITGNSNRIQ